MTAATTGPRPWHELAPQPDHWVSASAWFAAQALAHLKARAAATDPAADDQHQDAFLAAFTAAATVRCGWSWEATAAVAAGHARAAAALTEWLRADGIDPGQVAPAASPNTPTTTED